MSNDIDHLIFSKERRGKLGYYILDENRKPVLVDDIKTWTLWFEKADRKVEKTEHEGYIISTIFLGIDHGFGCSAPLLFETMIFTEKNDFRDLYCNRYSTEEEARAGHQEAIEWLHKKLREEVNEP